MSGQENRYTRSSYPPRDTRAVPRTYQQARSQWDRERELRASGRPESQRMRMPNGSPYRGYNTSRDKEFNQTFWADTRLENRDQRIRGRGGTIEGREGFHVPDDQEYARRLQQNRSFRTARTTDRAASHYRSTQTSRRTGNRVRVEGHDYRMDHITDVRQGEQINDDHLNEARQRAQERGKLPAQPQMTAAQRATNSSYKNSNIYSRRSNGQRRDIYADHSANRGWHSAQKRKIPWIPVIAIAVVVLVVVVSVVACAH